MAKVVTVFGATGFQGGAVARALARDPNVQVRGVTRDVYHPKIEQLKANGIDVLQCNLDDVNSIKGVLNNGVDACFVVTYTDFSDPECLEREIQQGKNIADACVSANIQHVVLSTQLHTMRILAISARHLVAKAEIEDYFIKEKRLPVTCILVPCYYENLFDYLKPERTDDKSFRLAIPMGKSSLDMIGVDDIGEVVRVAMNNRDVYLNKTLSVSGDKLTIKEMAAILSRYLSPFTFKDRQISLYDYRNLDLPWARDFGNMFDFFLRVDQRYNMDGTKKINPKVQRFDDWVRENANKLREEFQSM